MSDVSTLYELPAYEFDPSCDLTYAIESADGSEVPVFLTIKLSKSDGNPQLQISTSLAADQGNYELILVAKTSAAATNSEFAF